MNETKTGFHFQPLTNGELTQTDNAPLLFNSSPPGRKGRVTVFLKTRRTLRRRLGVHDLGQIDGVLQDGTREIAHEELKSALSNRTSWRYLFPPEIKHEPFLPKSKERGGFRSLVERTLVQTG